MSGVTGVSGIYRPDHAGARQVLVYLHGHGAAPDTVHPYFRRHHDDGRVRLCPQAPVPTEDGWSWFDSGPRGVERSGLDAAVSGVRTLTEATINELRIAWSEVVIGGFSQGASTALALAAALAADGHCLGGLLVQAGFLPEVVGDEVDLSGLHCGAVLIQQGDTDEVVPPFMAEDLATLISLSADVGRVDVQIVAGGHTLSTAMLDGARTWLATLESGSDLIG